MEGAGENRSTQAKRARWGVGWLLAWIGLFWIVASPCQGAAGEPEPVWKPGPGARIAIVGDGLAQGMARHGYWETALHLAFPDRRLSVRCFAWEGFRMDRAEAGPSLEALDRELAEFAPDFILVCCGANESYDGPERVAAFGQALRARCRTWSQAGPGLVRRTRLELIPPLPYVQSAPGMPDEVAANARLAPYAQEVRAVAGEFEHIGCIDLTPLFADLAFELSGDVTRDGRRLNRRGHWLLAMLTASKLGLPQGMGDGAGGTLDPAAAESLRQLVRRKESAWLASGREGGERGRGWDQALWSAGKAEVASLWAVEPDGEEPYPEAPGALGMPLPAQFGMTGRKGPEEAQEAMRVAGGVSVSLWGSEAGLELWNPVSLRFDGEGRAWVGCAPPGAEPCLLRIEDTDRDHRADRQVVAVSGAIHPEGFVPTPGGVYVSGPDGLLWFTDRDDDGAADHVETVLGGSSPRHGLRWGPGGSIWFREGGVETGAEARGVMETPWGAATTTVGGLRSWNPRIGRVEERIGAEAGPVGDLCFDEWAAPLVAMGQDGQPIGLDRVGGWPGRPPERRGGDVFSGPAGPWALLQGIPWPKELRGACVRAERNGEGLWELVIYRPEWAGSVRRWRRQEQPLLTTTDANFHPVAIEAGPDGALYVLDAYGRDKPLRAGSWGRIWRLAASRWPPSWDVPAHSGETLSLLQALHQGDPERCGGVRLALWHRPSGDVFPALASYLQSLTAPPGAPERQGILLESLRLHQAFGARNPELLSRLTESPSPAVRHAATDALGEWFADVPNGPNLLQRLIEDENPRVRLGALYCARRAGSAQAGAIAAVSRHQSMDEDLRAVVDATVTQLGPDAPAPPSLRAKAIATSTADLIAGEMTPHAASVLLARSGVENSVLRQAASVLAGRAGLSLERWIVERLEDRSSPDEVIDNLVKLIALAEGWELYQSGLRLRAIVESADRPVLRRAAFAALATGAAESGTLGALVEEISARGDYEMAGFLEGCALVMTHSKLRAAMAPVVRGELGGGKARAVAKCRRVRLVAPGWDVFHFAELEVWAAGQQVARGRTAVQSESPNGQRWWAALAKNGVNGIVDWEEELPLKGLVPGSSAVRGVKVAGSGSGGGPFWEVDLGEPVQVETLRYYPGEELPVPRPLRIELLDAEGRIVWHSTRYTRNEAPMEIDVEMSEQRMQAAVRVARLLGDDFRRSLETVARHSAVLPSRFSALRALQRLGGEVSGLRMRMVETRWGPEGFSSQSLVSPARDAVELSVRNETSGEVSLGVFEDGPGASGSLPIPLLPLGNVPPGEETRFPFFAPAKPGFYQIRPIADSPTGGEAITLRMEVTAPTPPSPPGKK